MRVIVRDDGAVEVVTAPPRIIVTDELLANLDPTVATVGRAGPAEDPDDLTITAVNGTFRYRRVGRVDVGVEFERTA